MLRSQQAYKAKQEAQHGGDIQAARAAARAAGLGLAAHPWGHKKYYNFILLIKFYQEGGTDWISEQARAAETLLAMSPETVDLELASCSSKFSSPLPNRAWKDSLLLTAAASHDTRGRPSGAYSPLKARWPALSPVAKAKANCNNDYGRNL